MKIVVTGGGSGGHITPILAVAYQVKKLQPDTDISFVGQRGDNLGDIPAQHASIDHVYTVRAGKLRRYHGEGWRQLLDIPTVVKNIRDVWWVFVGFWQSLALLRRLHPDVIFVKGGFVGVPVGLAAALLRIPYVTHDSDVIPGLANRIIAPWAKLHAVAMPKELYAYPAAKTLTVGVPISHEYHAFSAAEKQAVREQLGITTARVLFVTGGGNGAQLINEAVADNAEQLLRRYPDLTIVQLSGRIHEQTLRKRYSQQLSPADQKRIIVKGFVTNLHQYSGIADVVITRSGGTSMAEFAAQSKACIVIPNPLLTGGHQLKNAKVLADRRAVKVLWQEKLQADHGALMPLLTELLDSPKASEALGKQLNEMAQTDAATRLAVVLLETGKRTDT